MQPKFVALTAALLSALSGAVAAPTCIDRDDNPGFTGISALDGKTYVHLFEWTWESIAKECENFLGPMGYHGVQISPPNEHIVVTNPQYPWWQRYQPVSYKIVSRSGNREQFANMVSRCKAVGVEIYADAVINHMNGGGSGVGIGGTPYNADTLQYAVWSARDFHNCNGCNNCNIANYNDRYQVQHCRLVGLRDLNTGDTSYVQPTLANYLSDLVSLGVSGFRVDAAKHMDRYELGGIMSRVKDRTDGKGRPLVFQEVINSPGEPITAQEYVQNGLVTEFQYGPRVGRAFRKIGTNINSLKAVNSGLLDASNAVVFLDNHDNQRGHGAGGPDLVTFRMPREYTLANVFMLGYGYGFQQVMSSYYWPQNIQNGQDKNDWIGPPSYSGGVTKPADCATGEWMCEHRWPAISAMVRFRSAVSGTTMTNWWDNGSDMISFSRGNKGFVAINNHNYATTRTYYTGLPAGRYCDILDLAKVSAAKCDANAQRVDCGYAGLDENGCRAKGCCWSPSSVSGQPWCFWSTGPIAATSAYINNCPGQVITVDGSGNAQITINKPTSAVALHIGAMAP